MRITRRNLLKAGAGAAAGLWLGGRFGAYAGAEEEFGSVLFPPTAINAAELGSLRVDCLWAFIKGKPARDELTIQALGLEPRVRFRADNSGGEVKFNLTNVHGAGLEVQGAEVLERNRTSIKILVPVPAGGEAILDTRLPLPPKPIRFLAISDSHLGVPEAEEHFGRVVAEVNRRDALFALNAGDNVDEDNFIQWKRFEELVQGFDIPLFSTIGNHDSYFSDKRYIASRGNLFYGFAYGDALFLIMDNTQRYNKGTLYMSTGPKNAQWDWLPEAVKYKARHKFAAFHFPVYGRRGMTWDEYLVGDKLETREAEVERMMELFKENKVQYQLFGHIHSPMREETEGFVNLRLGGAGGSLSSGTDDKDINVAHIFMDENETRDYFVFQYLPQEGLEGIKFLEAPKSMKPGELFRPTVVGFRGEKLFGVDVEVKAAGAFEDLGDGRFKASAPGPATLAASLRNFTATHSMDII